MPQIEWLEAPEITDRVYSSAKFASNTDQVMYLRNQNTPRLKELRSRTQSCSLALGLRKR